jgi:hypothetical protein
MNDGRAIEVPGFDGIGPLTTWAIVVFGRPRYLPYSALPQFERPHSEGTEVIPIPEPLPDKPRIAGGFYMEQTALANRLCRPSLLHLEPVAFPSRLPTTPPNVQTQPVGAQEPLDGGILLEVFVAGTREPVMSCQSASSASGGKSVTGSDFDPASLPCPGGTALSVAADQTSTLPTLPLPSPRPGLRFMALIA